MKTVFITGANRGLGYGLAKTAIENGFKVLASCRNPEEALELKKLQDEHKGNFVVVKLDVSSDESVNELLLDLNSFVYSIDILINNAGVNSSTLCPDNPGKLRKLNELDRNLILKMFDINTVSPVLLVRSLMPFLKRSESPLIVNISSFRASFSDVEESADYAYTSSKVALNMMTKELAIELAPEGINTFCIDPGWVKTDMTRGEGDYTAEESASKIFEAIEKFDISQNGKFLSVDGDTAGI